MDGGKYGMVHVRLSAGSFHLKWIWRISERIIYTKKKKRKKKRTKLTVAALQENEEFPKKNLTKVFLNYGKLQKKEETAKSSRNALFR